MMLKRLLFVVLLALASAAQATVYSLPWGPKPQFVDANGAPMSGGLLLTFVAGSSTPAVTYTDSTGGTGNPTTITLNTRGETPNEVWLTSGTSYKFVLKDSSSVTIWTVDNVAGVNDVTGSLDEWKAGPAPTFVSTTSFTLAGDQTSTFHVGRRLKTTNSGGTVYSTITASAFGATTTVTVTNDSGNLDSGLSAVSYGLLSSTNFSLPGLINVGDQPIVTSAGTLRAASAVNEPINLSLTFSVSGNALTVAIKGRNGNDPSASNPVLVPFRSATAATGDYSWITLTSATSFVISSGSTIGSANSVAFRGWVVAFNDAGTLRIGVINCLTSAAGSGAGRDITGIFPLTAWGIASSTAEGGAGAADSAQVFYTGTAVTSKAYTTLGYFTYESGLATAGTYASTPTRAQLFGPSVPLPGMLVQVARTDTGALSTGTTLIPLDDTIPQSGEGDQVMSQAITPSSASNILSVRTQAIVASNQGSSANTIALFQDATANALKAAQSLVANADFDIVIGLNHLMLSSTTSSTTLKVRVGSHAAGTMTFNGRAGARLLGGVMNSYLEIWEIQGAANDDWFPFAEKAA